MHLNMKAELSDEPRVRVGYIGCGDHSFRNIFPTFQYIPIDLVAVCDFNVDKAKAFARQFGALNAYTDYHEMLVKEKPDAVFIVVGYDKQGRPLYPKIAADCLEAGCHVWIEKPPAATSAEIEHLQKLASAKGKQMMIGFKKMFFPANEKAKDLMSHPDFGKVSQTMIQYPQSVPTVDDFKAYFDKKENNSVRGFLDHLCHPASLMIYLMGTPRTLFYNRAYNGGALATFTFDNDAVASIMLTTGASGNGGMERTNIVGNKGKNIIVENNIRVIFNRNIRLGYGTDPSYFQGPLEEAAAMWEPEFSLGQLYNKGIFLLGYYGEVNEFAQAILQNRPVAKSHLDHALIITKLFELFAEGPGKVINIS